MYVYKNRTETRTQLNSRTAEAVTNITISSNGRELVAACHCLMPENRAKQNEERKSRDWDGIRGSRLHFGCATAEFESKTK